MAWDPPTPIKKKKPPLDPVVLVFVGIGLLMAYASWSRGNLGEEQILYFLVLIPSIVLHEVSHGWVAKMYGDPTADNAGRLTLNPVRHIDRFGTIILPALLLLIGAPAFGYAKPVPVNSARLNANQNLIVSLAGPFTNIVLALLATAAFWGVYDLTTINLRTLFIAIIAFGQANVILAVFNLIPIPPLDGSAVIERFLPAKYRPQYETFRKYSMFVLFALTLMFRGALNAVFDPALRLWYTLLP